jgi:hypothetical protein
MDEERLKEEDRKISEQLRHLRKPKMKFAEGDLVDNTKKEISAIKQSDLSFF